MKYKINKGFIVEATKKKTTIFDPEESSLYTLNEVGSVIFERVKRGESIDEIVQFITQRYDVPNEQAEKDIIEIVNDLKTKKIISDK